METRVYEGAAAAAPRQIRPKLRDIARFCVNTFRAFYAGNVGAAFTSVAAAAAAPAAGPATASTCPDGLAAQEASPRDPVMGNLQSETKKKGKKSKGAVDGTASTPGSIADGLDDATDTGDDGETAETQETPTKNVEECQKTGPEKRLPHKRQAPKPPGSIERKIGPVISESSEKKSHTQEKHEKEKEDASRKSIELTESKETKVKQESSGTLLIPATNQIQKQEPTLLVTDSWLLANKCTVVAEISMPPSQKSSSDSVFTDPDELISATNATKEEAAPAPSTFVSRNHEVEPSPMSPLLERRIVGTLTSALPEQLKSILTEAEVEQFVTRIYSRLVSDGIIGSITLDSVTQNKELTEDQSQCRDTPSISVSPSEEVFHSSGDRRDSEKETLKRELERLRELAKNADKTTQGKSTQTSPTTALPETSSEDLSKVKPSETFGSPLEKAIVQNSTNFQEQSSSTTSISDTSDSKDTKAVENDAAGVTRLSLAVTSPLSPSLQQVSSSPAYTSTPPPPPPPPPPLPSPFLNHRFQNNVASISQPSFSIPPPPPLPACSTSTQSFSSQHTITSLPTIPPPPPPPPLPPPTLQSATDEMHIAPPAPPPPPPPPSPAPSIGRQTSSVPSAPLPPPPPPPPPPPTQTALFNLIPPPPPPPPPPLPASSLSSASSITGLHAGPPIPPPPPPPPPPTSTSSIGSVSGGPAPPPPPPPPTPMIGVPPPPPPPPARMGDIPGGSPFPPPPPPPSMGVPGVPPPPAPGTQGTLQQPTPLPTPPVGGWNPASRACMRKEPLCPEIPMKPLYWTRILVPATPTEHGTVDDSDSAAQIPLWAELEEEKNLDMKEFANLFSRQVTARKPVKEADEASKPSKIQPAKILDSERSKAVGILEKSLRRVDFSEVENAVYNLDTSVVSLEVLQQIYKILPTQKELEDIKAFEESNPNVPLDRPEIFLKKLSGINHFSERIACLTFQSEFQDTISSISSKLTNLRSTCDFLRNSRSLKKVIALILTLGNYMNGGNRTRGQADGFGLEILEKLKDVKSNIPGVTLLHYVVRARLAQEKDHNCEEPLPLPIPEPADIEAASTINFENISAELGTLKAKLRVCIDKCEIIVNTDSEQLGPFKEKMDSVFREAAAELANEQEALLDAKNKFKAVMQFYQYTPKGSKNIDAVDPNSFFILWLSFCQDFKDIWKKEQQRMRKERIEEMRKKYESKTKVEKRKISATGLKARLQKLSRK